MFPLGVAWRNTGRLDVRIDAVEVLCEEPSRLAVYFDMHDTGLRDPGDPEHMRWISATRQETWLEVSYDSSRGSYVFDIRSRLEVKRGRGEAIHPDRFESGLEFQDLFPAGCFDRFPPHGRKRFAWFVYQGADGNWYKRPHTHHLGPDKSDIRFCRGGALAFLLDDGHNPVLELLDCTADFTSGSICWWAWDFHFLVRDPEAASACWTKPIEVRYRLYSLPRKTAQRLLSSARLDPVLALPAQHVPPFQAGVPNVFTPSEESRNPSDLWYWQSHDGPYVRTIDGDPNCFWDHGPGWQSPGSLAIRRGSEGRSFWACNALGKHYPPNELEGPQFRIEAYVRTQGLEGAAFLGWQFRLRKGGALVPGPMEYSAQRVSGDSPWTTISFETSVCADFDIAGVYLIQEGRGCSWFDHVSVLPYHL